MTDVMVFGETGLVAACRGPSGKPEPVAYGIVTAPRGQRGGIAVAEIKSTSAGTVAIRGPMVPRAAFPLGAERSGLPHFKVGANGFVDTGYGCRSDSTSIIVTGPPPGMVNVGGYRFMLEQAQALVHNVGNGAATLAALPDALAGHRLVGSAPGAGAIQHALAEQGINPLISGAFRNKAPAREAGSP